MITKLKNTINDNRALRTIFYPLIKLRRYYYGKMGRYYDEIFSNVNGGSIIVTLSNIPGKYELDARSHVLRSILISKEYEPLIVELIKKYTDKNRDAINIGANIGLYTNLLASLIKTGKKVLSVEPTPNAFRLLSANIRRNDNSHKVIEYNGLANDKAGTYDLNVVQGLEEYSSLGTIIHSSVADQKNSVISVEGDTIDNLVNINNLDPGIVVIDVEGAEYNVLSGAINTIRKHKPIIILELVDDLLKGMGSSSGQVVRLLKDNGYSVSDVEKKDISYPFTGNIIAAPDNI